MSCLVCCVGTFLTAASSCAGSCRTSLASLEGRRASLGWHHISTGWVLTSHTDHRDLTTVSDHLLLDRMQNVFYVIATSNVLGAKLCTTATTPQHQWFHFAERILYYTIVCIYNWAPSKRLYYSLQRSSCNFQTRHVDVMEIKTSTWMIRTGFNKAKVRFVIEKFAEVRRNSKVIKTAQLYHSSQCTDISHL